MTNEIKNNNMLNAAITKPPKIKALSPQIIVGGATENPCYSILYYDITNKEWNIGYSSYNLAFVKAWEKECFEVAGELDDLVYRG